MKCTTTKELLQEAVQSLDRMAGKHASLPVLHCVLLTVSGEVLTVEATNLEVGARRVIPCTDSVEGRAAVPASVLAGVVSTLPPASAVNLERTESGLMVTTTQTKARLAVEDDADFPSLPMVADGTKVQIDPRDLLTALQAVVWSASPSTIKPELASVYVHFDGSELRAAATDSFRLAEKRVSQKNTISLDPLLIPARNVPELIRALERARDTAELAVNENQLSLTAAGTYFTTRLVAGSFPNYNEIIPKEYAAEATMLTSDIEQVLRKAAVFADKFNQTTITLDTKQKLCTVHTESQSVGELTDTVHVALTGASITQSFNQRYLIDAFQSIRSDSVTFSLKGPGAPMVARGVGDTSFTYLVMPMNR